MFGVVFVSSASPPATSAKQSKPCAPALSPVALARSTPTPTPTTLREAVRGWN
jgi:hypothetical protein